MAEQLGEAVLTVSADTRQLEAGLQRARQQGEQTGQAISQAFNGAAQGASSSIRSIQSLQAKLQSLRASYETVQIGSKGFRDLQREIQKTEQELQRVDKTLGAVFAQRAGNFGAGLLGALGVGVGVGAGALAGGFLRESIQQAIELETITKKLSNTLGAQGASGALNFTKGLANELGLNFKTLADAYSRFTAAATAANVPLDTQKGLFSAVSKAGQSLGLSNDEINGSFIALQQVASKGTVAMEELRGQLGERLPIALAATARGLGISQQELIKLVESGKLTASQFFPALTKGLNELTAGAGGLETTAQKLAKFTNAWEQFQLGFANNILPTVTEGINLLTKAIEGLTAKREAADLQRKFKLLSGDADTLAQNRNQIQKEFNLPTNTADALLGQALRNANPSKSPFGQLILDGKQFAQVQLQLIDLAKAYRAANPDRLAQAAAQTAKAEEEKKQKEASLLLSQKQLDIDLRRNQAALQLSTAQERLASARLTPQLDEVGRTALQNRLSLNEKIRDVQAQQLQLQRELDKPKGAGDGKALTNGTPTQNLKLIEDLQNKIRVGQVDIATQRIQNQQAEAAALRTQEERVRQQQLELTLAQSKLNVTQQQTQLERDALATGQQVSATDLLRLRNQEAIAQKLEQQKAAQQALQAELSKPKDQQDRVVVDDLLNKQAKANADVRQAYADAGLSLVQNARQAAEALKAAQQAFNSTARGNFELLTSELQQQQIDVARQSVGRGIERGLIRGDLDLSSPEKLFRAAAASESLINAQDALQKAVLENAKATKALAAKDWNVYVSNGGGPMPPAPAPTPQQTKPLPISAGAYGWAGGY